MREVKIEKIGKRFLVTVREDGRLKKVAVVDSIKKINFKSIFNHTIQ